MSVAITSQRYDIPSYYDNGRKKIEKLIHKDVALKLGLMCTTEKEVVPEVTPTFESQLSTLLKDYIADLVYGEVSDQMNK